MKEEKIIVPTLCCLSILTFSVAMLLIFNIIKPIFTFIQPAPKIDFVGVVTMLVMTIYFAFIAKILWRQSQKIKK